MVAWVQKIVIQWKIFYLYAFVLVLLSILPINSSGSSINHVFIVSIRLDYLLHCLIYIPLVLFLWIDKESALLSTPGKAFIWFIILLIFAVITEVIQYFLTYRAFNINDMLANGLGIIIGFVMVFFFRESHQYNR